MSYMGKVRPTIALLTDDIADDQVTSAKIADTTIVDADVNASAAIAKTKLASLDVVNADVNASAAIVQSKLATLAIDTAELVDNGVPLGKLEDGTQGDILYYGASGAPARLGFGTDGHFLKTQGTGANPVWAADTGGLFESYACIADKVAASVAMQTITSGAWRTRNINTEITDPDGIVSISSDQFTLAAGSYILRVSMEVTKGTGHSTRIYDITNTAVVEYGGAGYMDTGNNEESWAPVIARVTPSGATVYEVQQIVTATATPGSSSSHSDQMYLFCEIFKDT